MASNKIISAYYNYYGSPADLPQPEDLNVDLITHLIVCFTSLDSTTGQCTANQQFRQGLQNCAQLRLKNPTLKVMVSVGTGQAFSVVANSPALIQAFVTSIVSLLEECSLDGLDLDWEFPVFQSQAYDRENFVALLQALRQAFTLHTPQYLLAIAAAAQELIAVKAYDIPAIAQLVDFVNLMCYDYNVWQAYTPFTGHNSPLFRRPCQISIFGRLNTEWSANYWVSQGLPKAKLVVGIPMYPRGWKLLTACLHGYGAPSTATDWQLQSYTAVRGWLADGAVRVFDTYAKVPYAYKGTLWVSYEDEESIRGKTEWITINDFGGAMLYDLKSDDYAGVYGPKFPLVSIVHEVLQ
ncbi:putative Acidic mammalian chitinase [Hypsibius exemplaris]|uniref:Acidic mammalian chitinase n=1 Tax=Hypsibius exemplaris TaxID=2072580 RepID=A0A9X6NI92_HYPEX|nr:putative Acidic mammalian chitinase [Hypsibius exemplaris]